MVNLNLEAKNSAQQRIKEYLEQNASDVLAEKINNGVSIEKDGKVLINRKTLDGFMSYATEEARKTVENGARSACIESAVVFGWAIHYFEEESIEGTLYNEDGTECAKPKPAPKKAKEKKWEIEVNKQEISGDVVCITMNSSSKKQPIVLSAHIDTVFPLGSFVPLIRYDDDKIYGPGTRDCKGGVVAGFYAMDILEQIGYSDRPIMLILQSDEEPTSVGSNKATINYMIEK